VSIYNFWITDSTSASTHLYYLIYIFKELSVETSSQGGRIILIQSRVTRGF
jgi:hypothetical protein